MASVPKTTALTAASPAHSVRNVGPAARVASASSSQIDALNDGANVAFDTAASGFQEGQTQSNFGQDDGRRQRHAEPGAYRLFTADSQAFAAIFQGVDKALPAAKEGVHTRMNGSTLGNIIKTYETNALVISGQQPMRGTSFSFNL